MSKKIDLEEIFNNNFDCYTEIFEHSCKESTYEQAVSKDKFKELCLKFGKQLLELAAENAVTVTDIFSQTIEVDKQSILDTINQIK
jgi:hypothetical protein